MDNRKNDKLIKALNDLLAKTPDDESNLTPEEQKKSDHEFLDQLTDIFLDDDEEDDEQTS
jgi:hypothetical protein